MLRTVTVHLAALSAVRELRRNTDVLVLYRLSVSKLISQASL